MSVSASPNVIVFLTDDQRADTLEYMPVLRRLAETGVVFENSFVTSPVCTPSRVSFLTGNLASTHGVLRNGDGGPDFDARRTIATAVQSAGYRTGFFGKYPDYHLLYPKVPPGWDEWFAFRINTPDYLSEASVYSNPAVSWNGHAYRGKGHSTDLLATHALRFVRAQPESPFFVVLSTFAPHHPLRPTERFAGVWEGLDPPHPPSLRESDLSDKPRFVRERATHGEELWRSSWGPYVETLLSVDSALAKVEGEIEELGIAENTVLIFTSDNGFMFGEHGQRAKGLAYEPSIRVPLIVRYPERFEPHEVEQLVLNIDLAPTIAELVGVDFPADGESLMPLLLGERPRSWRTEFAVEMDWPAIGFTYTGTRSETRKTVVWANGETEHYDLEADPFELDGRDARE